MPLATRIQSWGWFAMFVSPSLVDLHRRVSVARPMQRGRLYVDLRRRMARRLSLVVRRRLGRGRWARSPSRPRPRRQANRRGLLGGPPLAAGGASLSSQARPRSRRRWKTPGDIGAALSAWRSASRRPAGAVGVSGPGQLCSGGSRRGYSRTPSCRGLAREPTRARRRAR